MGKVNRVCKTCGKAYYYCSNCNKSINSPQWMLMWDTENCKNVYEIVSNYAQGVFSKDDARKRLEKCDLKQKYTFNKKIANYIDEIMKKDVEQEIKQSLEEKKDDSPKKGRLFEKVEKETEDK